MPHITLECTDNVDMDFHSFFEELAQALVETGHAARLGIKARKVTTDSYYIVDGCEDYKMVNLLFRLREGRDESTLRQFSEIGIGLLEKYLQKDIEHKAIIISTEIKELIKDRDITKNAIR